MNSNIKKIILLTLLFLSTTLSANIAKVVALQGNASIYRDGKIISITKQSIIFKQDKIMTKKKSKVQLLFKDNTVISIGENSSFQVAKYIFDENNKKFEAKFSMIRGTFRTITGKIGKIAPEKFTLKTKSSTIGIRGTQIVLDLTEEQEKIFCTEGKIIVQKLGKNISSTVNAGEFVTSNNKNTKFKVKKIEKSDIQKINKKIQIKDNLAIDNISIEKEKKNTLIVEKTKTVNPIKIVSPTQSTKSSQEEESTQPEESVTVINIIKNIFGQIINNSEENNNLSESFDEITPKSYFQKTNSVATYKGDFNNYSYDKKDQYLKDVNENNVSIPTDTSISMNIDFGATKDHISNGKILINDSANNYSETFEFDGKIKDIKKANFELKGLKDITSGNGKGNFYGSEANLMQGEVNFKSKISELELKGEFDATKQ